MKTNLLYVHPHVKDVNQIKAIWEDEKTMADVGGVKKKTELELKKFILNHTQTSGNNYYLVYNNINDLIGEVGVVKEKEYPELVLTVEFKNRRLGYGTQMLDYILSEHFLINNEDVLVIKSFNDGSHRFLKSYGFPKIKKDSVLELTRRMYLDLFN